MQTGTAYTNASQPTLTSARKHTKNAIALTKIASPSDNSVMMIWRVFCSCAERTKGPSLMKASIGTPYSSDRRHSTNRSGMPSPRSHLLIDLSE